MIQCGADGIPSQVQTAHGGVLVANTHLVSPHLREGNMQTASRSLMFNEHGPVGGAALAEGLKGNTTLESLEYAACVSNQLPSVRLYVSAR